MDSEEEIFALVRYAGLSEYRNTAGQVLRQWLSDPVNNANATDDHAFSLLHWAVVSGVSELILTLLEHGAKVNVMNNCGDTPLHLAAQMDRIDAAEILLQVPGIIVAAPNKYGNTPLHYATFFHCKAVALKLAEYGSPLDMKNDNGNTPLDMIHRDFAEQLQEFASSVKCNTPPPFVTKQNRSLDSPVPAVPDSASNRGLGLASFDIVEAVSDSPEDTCWFGYWEGQAVIGRSCHIRRTPLPKRLAVQLMSESERLKTSHGTLAPHVNILPLLSCLMAHQGAGEPVLVSRYQKLGSLFDVLHSDIPNRPKIVLDQRQTYRFALDIALGMEYLHSVMQDTSTRSLPRFHLNSRNILLDIDPHDAAQEPVAKLYLAKCDLPGITDIRRVRYPAWYSPEELLRPPSSVRLQPADMWSMGVVLFELVTLCVPFAGFSPVEIGIKVALESARVHLISKTPGISAHVERLLGLFMNENPECRPSFDQVVPVFRRMIAAANANAPS